MSIVKRLGYLVLGVSNLSEAMEYYSKFVRLDVTARRGNTVFMTGGLEHHWLRLEEGTSEGLKRIAYEADGEGGLAMARERLAAANIGFTEGGNLAADGVERWLRFVDPSGFDIELFTGMIEQGIRPNNPGITMEKFLHAAWVTPDYERSIAFYQAVLGFKPSDWIEDRAGFFRAGDGYHHSLVIVRGDQPAFNHFCIQVETLDDVMRARSNALRGGVTLRDDILRHAPSGSIGFYMKDVARKFAVEFCVGHPQLDDATHQPRILPGVPETRDVWSAPLPTMGISRLGKDPDPADVVQYRTWQPGTDVPSATAALRQPAHQ